MNKKPVSLEYQIKQANLERIKAETELIELQQEELESKLKAKYAIVSFGILAVSALIGTLLVYSASPAEGLADAVAEGSLLGGIIGVPWAILYYMQKIGI